MVNDTDYSKWEQIVPQAIKGDTLWKLKVYRMGLYIADISWTDVTTLSQDRRTVDVSDQLYRALGSISANIAEGYSKSSGKDRARFYEYALGSAREARDWYFKSRHILAQTIVEHRLDYLSQIIRLLLTILPDQRQIYIKEDVISYATGE
jgi:four helix bundle protein